jgi:hypothetical protein
MSITLIPAKSGIGNHLFTIASSYGLSKTYNKTLFVNKSCHIDPHSKSKHEWIYDQLRPASTENAFHHFIHERPQRCLSLDEDVIQGLHGHELVQLKGYFQCEKYFKDYYQDICEMFKPPTHILEYIHKEYPLTKFSSNSYFLHVRLGDYISTPLHFVSLSKYYETCVNALRHVDAPIYVFSNETYDRCMKFYPILKKYKHRMTFIDEPDQLVSLFLMSMCKFGGICANSSFSWWGSYLNQNKDKDVYMPSKWVNKPWKVDIYFENVHIIDV